MTAAVACWSKIGANGRNRRASPVAAHPGKGPLIEPTAAAQLRQLELVFMPQRSHRRSIAIAE
jgi:hypothetical protein